MKQHQKTIGSNDEWLTPPNIINALGSFDLDPCSPIDRPWDTASRHLTIKDDGLFHDWSGRVWCNPPFNRNERPKWMRKMSEHGNWIMLIPANMETKAFSDYVFGIADGILILDKRPYFHYVSGDRANGNSGTTIALIAYGEENLRSLIESGLGTVLKEVTA